MDIYVVDAFTDQQFKGNSAAVVPVKEWPTDLLMQDIAAENNLSETAFIKYLSSNSYAIRWFSPLIEIDFCGHATLAASYVLFFELGITETIEYVTENVGTLAVALLVDDKISMSFPNQIPTLLTEAPADLINGLSKRPISILRNRQAYFAVFESETDIVEMTYQTQFLKKLAPYDVVVTACTHHNPDHLYDFVSRYFWPANGGEEDPVTGSIHAGLAPYWAKTLAKNTLTAYQASSRGGMLYCDVIDDRVVIAGFARLYLKGKIYV